MNDNDNEKNAGRLPKNSHDGPKKNTDFRAIPYQRV